MKYFVDKCLPFGASISCTLYQEFSDALKYVIQRQTSSKAITNYLEDFLFAALTCWLCNQMILKFMELCKEINIPIADEKTEWACTCIVFLGILLDGSRFLLSIPLEKQRKALNLLQEITSKKRVTIKQLQTLTGYLNFLSKARVSGRTFTRRIYNKFAVLEINKKTGRKLKPYHHVVVDQELRFDCEVWKIFLQNFTSQAVCRPTIDIRKETYPAEQVNFFSDASANEKLGMGAVFNSKWLFRQWEQSFIAQNRPSIEYLELVGVVTAVLTLGHLIRNKHVVVFCDNMAAAAMINSMTSSCKKCMYLLCLLALNNMVHNGRTFA